LGFEHNSGFFCQLFEDFLKVKVIPLHYKAEQIPTLIALPKAAPGLSIREYHKRWRASVAVKGTKANIVFASPFQFDRLTDDVNQFKALFYVIYYCHGYIFTALLEKSAKE
jgi:hypothetical protein